MIQLSCANKTLRTKLLPRIFETVRFSNEEATAAATLAAVKIHGTYTTHIQFTATSECEDEHFNFVHKGHAQPWTWGCMKGFFRDLEDHYAIRQAEKEYQWRALMNETWRALSLNMSMTELTVDRFIPKWTSAFGTRSFHDFLSRLEAANFRVLGDGDTDGPTVLTARYYAKVVGHMDEMFFCHMHNVKSLSLRASAAAVLGLLPYDTICAQLPLRPGYMPRLQFLELQNCTAGHELLNFLADHREELREVHLDRCFVREVTDILGTELQSQPPGTSIVTCWNDFLDGVRSLEPPKLTAFVAGGVWRGDDLASWVDEDESDDDSDYSNDEDCTMEFEHNDNNYVTDSSGSGSSGSAHQTIHFFQVKTPQRNS
ncbi:hypothetical protein ISF_09679 [Cordyceps fumosorosea ARSEF 2679]|uniref:Uncharacterized protein n=1 Tax=Cordyceps fumosorosea (strain ARSEF 2679) TaxID=1081104 RepID=A0A162JJV1_CORFA|nr:hypothetical protein ISF_09679 [Cordyceps fumosorosea ARSEF 2679]OAA43053.1 hypothetical protein ISF_09679 [Cordyceps fumosorosea ARSEF 2679]